MVVKVKRSSGGGGSDTGIQGRSMGVPMPRIARLNSNARRQAARRQLARQAVTRGDPTNALS